MESSRTTVLPAEVDARGGTGGATKTKVPACGKKMMRRPPRFILSAHMIPSQLLRTTY
jgi:hypothetical protein